MLASSSEVTAAEEYRLARAELGYALCWWGKTVIASYNQRICREVDKYFHLVAGVTSLINKTLISNETEADELRRGFGYRTTTKNVGYMLRQDIALPKAGQGKSQITHHRFKELALASGLPEYFWMISHWDWAILDLPGLVSMIAAPTAITEKTAQRLEAEVHVIGSDPTIADTVPGIWNSWLEASDYTEMNKYADLLDLIMPIFDLYWNEETNLDCESYYLFDLKGLMVADFLAQFVGWDEAPIQTNWTDSLIAFMGQMNMAEARNCGLDKKIDAWVYRIKKSSKLARK